MLGSIHLLNTSFFFLSFICLKGFGLFGSLYVGLIYLFNRFYSPSLIPSLNICHSANYPKDDAGVLAGQSQNSLAVSRVVLDISSKPVVAEPRRFSAAAASCDKRRLSCGEADWDPGGPAQTDGSFTHGGALGD